MTHKVSKSYAKQDGHNTYVIMKTIPTTGFQQNGFVTSQAFGHMIYVINSEILHCIEKPLGKVLLFMYMYNVYLYLYVYIYVY